MDKSTLVAELDSKQQSLALLEAALIRSELYQLMLQRQGEVKQLTELIQKYFPEVTNGDSQS